MIAPIEIAYQIGKNPEDYGGTYKVGAYYDSSAAPDLPTSRYSTLDGKVSTSKLRTAFLSR